MKFHKYTDSFIKTEFITNNGYINETFLLYKLRYGMVLKEVYYCPYKKHNDLKVLTTFSIISQETH